MAKIKNEKKKEIMDKILSDIKMHDAGKKPQKMNAPIYSDGNIMYPSLYLDIKQAPGLEGYEVEDKVTMIIEGVISSHSVNENKSRKNEDYCVSIKKIGVKPKMDK